MKRDKIGFSLLKITTEQFAVIESAYNEKENIQLGVGFEFGIDPDHRVIANIVRFELLTQNNPFLIIHVRCDFSVEENAWEEFSCVKTKSICFPKGFITHLSVLTVGTARGILHCKTENSRFNEFFLPTINVTDFVNEDVSFEMNK